MTETLIAGGTVLTPDGLMPLDLALDGGRITALLTPGSGGEAGEVIDATGLTVLPGIVDIHFHVRAPAYPERGTVQTETRAAAAGGVTTIFEMPISKPCCSTPQEVAARREHFAQNAVVNFALIAAMGDLTPASRDAMLEEGAVAFKIFTTPAPAGREDEFGGLSFPGEAEQLAALHLAAESGRVLIVHAESAELLAAAEQRAAGLDPADAATHEAARPAICETVAVAKLLAMNIEAQARLHIAHVTSAETVEVLRAFAGTSPFTAETCPQYLFFTSEDVAKAGIYAKVNPPIRGKSDQDALWEAIADGVITHVTTDHAPFAKAEKQAAEGNFLTAPPGVPGIEVFVPAMLDAVSQGRLSLPEAHRLMCSNGARLHGIYPRKGAILPGSDADLVLVDLAGPTSIEAGSLKSHARDVAHLFHGRRFQGKVCRTLVAGETVFRDGEVTGEPGQGRFVRP